jgi:hypothetical protein
MQEFAFVEHSIYLVIEVAQSKEISKGRRRRLRGAGDWQGDEALAPLKQQPTPAKKI